MKNLYPLFERNRILKKELLWSLRDYSFAHIQLEYQEYSQGIIQGCDIKVLEDQLVVGPGIIKYGDFICLMTEEEKITYTATEQTQYLKIKMDIDQSSQDYISYQLNLILDGEKIKKDNEFELCRFNLRRGAKLRTEYKNFYDMETEYDTVNLIHASWSGLGGETLSPVVSRYFAEALLENKNSQAEDISFAYHCLSQPGAIPVNLLIHYINGVKGEAEKGLDKLYVFERMCSILKSNNRNSKSESKSKERHKIFVD